MLGQDGGLVLGLVQARNQLGQHLVARNACRRAKAGFHLRSPPIRFLKKKTIFFDWSLFLL